MRLSVLASGEGTTFEAIAAAVAAGRLDAELVGLVTDRPAAVTARARRRGIATACLVPRAFADRDAWDDAVARQLSAWDADWVACAGFLALIGPRTLDAFAGRIVNTHPSLLPKYGGAGMYGARVHRAVLAAGEPESGVTIHRVDAEFDRGEIIAQVRVPVESDDTPETLAARVQTVERRVYPETLATLLRG